MENQVLGKHVACPTVTSVAYSGDTNLCAAFPLVLYFDISISFYLIRTVSICLGLPFTAVISK